MSNLSLEITKGGMPVGRVSLPMSALESPISIGASGDIRVPGLLPQHVQLKAGPAGSILVSSVNPARPAAAHGRPIPLQLTPLRLPVQVQLGETCIEFTLEADAPSIAPPPVARGSQTTPNARPSAMPLPLPSSPPMHAAHNRPTPGAMPAVLPAPRTPTMGSVPPPRAPQAPQTLGPANQVPQHMHQPPQMQPPMQGVPMRHSPMPMPMPTAPQQRSSMPPAMPPVNAMPLNVPQHGMMQQQTQQQMQTMPAAAQQMQQMQQQAPQRSSFDSLSNEEKTGFVDIERLRAAAAARKPPEAPAVTEETSVPGMVADMPQTQPPQAQMPMMNNVLANANVKKAAEAPKTIPARLLHDWKRTSNLMKVMTAVLPVIGVLLISSTSSAKNQANAANAAAENGQEAAVAVEEGAPLSLQDKGERFAQKVKSGLGLGEGPQNVPVAADKEPQEDQMQKLGMSVHSVSPKTAQERAVHKQAMMAIMTGDYDTAMKLANQLATVHPESPTYYDVMRVIYSKQKTQGRR